MPRRVARRAPSSAAPVVIPPDLVEESVERLGWVALGLAAAMAGVYAIGAYLQPGWINPAEAPASYRVSILVAAVSGVVMFIAAMSKRHSPYLILDAGLVFEVFAGLLISIAENSVPHASGEVLRGHSSVALWIAFFVLAVPASFGKTAIAAAATACMGPLGLATQVILGNVPQPHTFLWILPFGSSFLMAAAAASLARLMYYLGREAEVARDLGSYHLLDRLDQGGMGEVWRARHRMLARLAAIKLIRADVLSGGSEQAQAAMRRFEREAQATAQLQSPHTVTLYDYGVSDDGCFYYVMELLDGINLDELVRTYGPVPAGRAVWILEQICDSLIEAHSRGLVHRDIKPGNILLCRLGNSHDFVKVLDFGLVRHISADQSQLTADGVVAGTPAFLAPEVAEARKEVDPRADLYSLGCVAYWLVTGRFVFEEPTPMAMVLAHLRRQPVPPSQATENEVPSDLEKLILDCLEKEPARRPRSAAEVAARLAECRSSRPWNAQLAEDWWRAHRPGSGEMLP